jgi:stearoyl-CoA desaturase (delta-9 desaturase)
MWTQEFYWPNWAQHWSALHRKHHRYSDTELDPHSPHHMTIKEIFNNQEYKPGKPYYISPEEIRQWAGDVPKFDDWMEYHVYQRYGKKGVWLSHIVNLVLFGPIGLVLGYLGNKLFRKSGLLHNYLSHKFGFHYEKNINSADRSVNMFPIGLIWCGDELAANHHNDPSRAKLSKRWWEIDPGWGWIVFFSWFNLIKVNKNVDK